MAVTQWKFESSSERGKWYTTRLLADKRLGCDCRGWIQPQGAPGTTGKNGQPGGTRYCTHCKTVVETMLRCKVRFANGYAYAVLGKDAAADVRGATRRPTPLDTRAANTRARQDRSNVAVIVEPAPAGLAGFVAPQLAAPMAADIDTRAKRLAAVGTYAASAWAMEEKFDGHRVVIDRHAEGVCAWSRPGRSGDPLKRLLPPHITQALLKLPVGTYDGELIVPGGDFSAVTDLAHTGKQVYMVFDVMRLLGRSVTRESYTQRRAYLEEIFSRADRRSAAVRLAESWAPSAKKVEAIWAAGGEGAILKNRTAAYRPGARTDAFIKVKKVASAVFEITGFTAGKLGPYSTVNIRDPKGVVTSVKTLNTTELRRAAANPSALIGAQLRVEYTSRTKDGAYLNPHWDRIEAPPAGLRNQLKAVIDVRTRTVTKKRA
jgi:ATP dependent DNA ligase domain